MGNQIRDIFTPGRGVEIAFNINSLAPTIRSSIIFECDHDDNIIIIAQSTPPMLPGRDFDEMSLTTTVTGELSRITRVGVSCKITDYLNHYQLSGDNTTKALKIKYSPSMFEGNIRSAYRHNTNTEFNVGGVLTHQDQQYISGKSFKLFDISVTGTGMLLPKTIKRKKNPMLQIKASSLFKLNLLLIRTMPDKTKKKESIEVKASAIRTNSNYNDLYGFMGVKFTKISRKDEMMLSQFVHEAQLFELRKMNKR
ncbi:MAG: hypothetical protein B6I31_01910 [Desulfobacteraceae bacterium 4572_19]|nr:MAG: hypothetical protein B6I31_01910 [Desulfobacteraceae bacterium 4572_19]